MTRLGPYLLAAASIAFILCALGWNFSSSHHDAPSSLSVRLAHGDIAVLASSYALQPSVLENRRLNSELRAIAASVTEEDASAMSVEIFEKSKFSLLGSHNNGSQVSFSTRRLDSKPGDKQFFVQFSFSADIYTLVALAKFTGRPVVSHVHDDLYLAIGGDSFSARARQFPGVVWVQERTGSDKVGSSLKLLLDELTGESIVTRLRSHLFPRSSKSDPIVALIAQCWYDACGTAAKLVQTLCPDVYVYPELVEVQCRASAVERSVALLTSHAGVEHVDIKQRTKHKNFAGSAILGYGPSATSISESRVLTSIDVSGSIIGVADSGINMNNCYFYDASKPSFPYADSRVIKQYTFQDCTKCGRCCASYSPSGCTNELNACGNAFDQNVDGHGTHVAGTIAGNAGASAPASLGNGIAAGAKLYFQDIENLQPDATCYYTKSCDGFNTASNLAILFDPAYAAGVYVPPIPLSSAPSARSSFLRINQFCDKFSMFRRVHSNSWGCAESTPTHPFACNAYTEQSKTLDSFA
jgi:hypothetical protein